MFIVFGTALLDQLKKPNEISLCSGSVLL